MPFCQNGDFIKNCTLGRYKNCFFGEEVLESMEEAKLLSISIDFD